jgi:hypothetical protein
MLHNEEFIILYRLPNSQGLRWAWHDDRMEEFRSAFKMLRGKRPLGGRKVYGRTMHPKEIGVNIRNCVVSVQDRDYWGLCECGIEPPGLISHGII